MILENPSDKIEALDVVLIVQGNLIKMGTSSTLASNYKWKKNRGNSL